MNFRQLETFYWIVQLGSFRAAALKLNTTQSTVSMRIMQLEKELGAKLFDRINRRARLTQKGRSLVNFAEQSMIMTNDIQQSISDRSNLSGTVKLGLAELIALTWLPDLTRKLNQSYPKVTVVLDIDLTANLRRKLDDGDNDILLIPGPINAPGLESVYLGSVEYLWMASPRLKLPRQVMTPHDLQSWPVVTLPHESILYLAIDDWFMEGGTQAKRVNICNNLNIVAALTVAGLGISLLPYSYYQPELECGDIEVIRTEPRLPLINYYAVYIPNRRSAIGQIISELASETSTFARV